MNDKIPRRVIKYFPFLPSLAWSIFEFLEYYRNIVMVSGSWSSRKQHCSINSQDDFIDKRYLCRHWDFVKRFAIIPTEKREIIPNSLLINFV